METKKRGRKPSKGPLRTALVCVRFTQDERELVLASVPPRKPLAAFVREAALAAAAGMK